MHSTAAVVLCDSSIQPTTNKQRYLDALMPTLLTHMPTNILLKSLQIFFMLLLGGGDADNGGVMRQPFFVSSNKLIPKHISALGYICSAKFCLKVCVFL